MFKKLILAFTFCLFVSSAWAATYYVNSSSTGGDGTTTATTGANAAFKTIAEVNAATFAAGDSILFNRGQTWREQLIPDSGSVSGVITYGTYGTGAMPKLLGSYQKNNTSDWTDGGSNIWSVSPDWSATSAQTKLLADFNGANNATSYTSIDAGARTATFTGGAKLSNAQKMFSSSASLLLTTAGSDYISFPDSADWIFGTGDFTIDLNVRFASLPITGNQVTFVEQYVDSTHFLTFSLCNSSGTYQMFVEYVNGGTHYYIGYEAITAPSLNVWYHVAYVRSSGNFLFYWNGTLVGTDSGYTALSLADLASVLYIGYGVAGYIDEVSVAKVAKWTTATFPLPQAEYSLLTTVAQNFLVDVGNLIFNNEASCGVKMTTKVGCIAQGNFFYEFTTNKLYMYSVGNPATFYTNIECALKQPIINAFYSDYYPYNLACNYITFDGLDLRYSGSYGILFYTANNNIVQNCNFKYIGGGDQNSNYLIRLGTGIEIWDFTSNITVQKNTFDNCFYYAVAMEGNDAGGTQSGYTIINNIITNTEIAFGYYNEGGGASTTSNVHIENNTCYNLGGSFAHLATWTEPTYGNGFIDWEIANTFSNFYIRNNIFSVATNNALLFVTAADVSNFTIDYNDFNVTTVGRLHTTDYTTIADWRTASSQDAHSISADPLFISSSDFHLQSGSPAINTGVTIAGVTDDYDGAGRPQGPAYDMGAYERDNNIFTVMSKYW